MDEIINLLRQMEVSHLLAMAAMLWWFNGRLERKFDRLDSRLEKLETQINSIDKRLFAVEAILHMKGCCAITDDKHLQKAE